MATGFPAAISAGVVELVDSMDLGSITSVVCGFESRRPHQTNRRKRLFAEKARVFKPFKAL